MADALRRGQISGDGEYTRRCHDLLERELGVACALLTTSCTHALEMAALLLDIQPGDEFIVPSFTFVSTVNAFALRGGRPVFVDIRPDTLNIDERKIEAAITGRTRAIVVVHYAGVACDMDAICAIAARHAIPIVEDNAHGLFGKYRGRYLGTFGCLATQSFHETKNIVCGEGGALLVNDEALLDRAYILREKGTNRRQFLQGQAERYTWVDVGSSYLPSDCLAAFLYAQLEQRARIYERRRWAWNYYATALSGWRRPRCIGVPCVPADRQQTYHIFYLLLPTPAERDAMIGHLRAAGILSVFHYVPLHTSPMGRSLGGRPGQCPVTEDVSGRLLRLPLYYDITEAQLESVVEQVQSFWEAPQRGAYCG
jgi:dTDP-4-amino-4,6-dideoxygalactose transaminase